MKVRTYERVMTDEARVCQGGKRYIDIRGVMRQCDPRLELTSTRDKYARVMMIKHKTRGR